MQGACQEWTGHDQPVKKGLVEAACGGDRPVFEHHRPESVHLGTSSVDARWAACLNDRVQQPGYIAIEGLIGVGKTSLTLALARRFNGQAILEPFEDNPFLEKFYVDPEPWAFQTQLFFLLNRFKQLQEARQPSLFLRTMVCDYLFAKDTIFAHATLTDAELRLYDQIYELLHERVPRPDITIYLQAPLEVLLQRIAQRDRHYEREIDPAYLERLIELYNQYFFHYTDSPLLVVQTTHLDFVRRKADLDLLVKEIEGLRGGTKHLIPHGSSLLDRDVDR
jgi:deoxyadenosine/deoxycytidine kinase